MKVDRRRAARQQRIAKQLSETGFALPGSLTVRAYPCGKANCRCKADPSQLHGPYAFWTRKVNGKTATRMLTPDEVAEYQPLFDNARKLRDLISQLQELTLELVEGPAHAPAPAPSRTTRKPTKPKTQPRRQGQ